MIRETWNSIGRSIEKEKAELIINSFIDVVRNELKNNNDVKIDGFGSFSTRFKSPHVGKDVNSGELKNFQKIKYIDFKPSKKLK